MLFQPALRLLEVPLCPLYVSNGQIASCRHYGLTWIVLFSLFWSFLPSASLAQQPTATISTLSGTVLVNGQEQGIGTVLNAGDVIQTQAGARVVLKLSDGSQLELGEKTRVDLAELTQTATGARVSLVKLLWGRIRATLSPEHQSTGSAFDVETPNALIGVKFSQPDIEVSYSQENAETIGIAHTVELLAKNLLTNEEMLVPVGSTVIITGITIKIIAGIVSMQEASGNRLEVVTLPTTTLPTTEVSVGMGTGSKIALGVGAAVVVAGGVAAITASSDEGNNSGSDVGINTPVDLSGTWRLMMSGTDQEFFNGVLQSTGPFNPDRCT